MFGSIKLERWFSEFPSLPALGSGGSQRNLGEIWRADGRQQRWALKDCAGRQAPLQLRQVISDLLAPWVL